MNSPCLFLQRLGVDTLEPRARHLRLYGAMQIAPTGLESLVGRAARLFGVEPEEIMRVDRRAHVVRARQFVMWTLRRKRKADGSPAHSFAEIGRVLHLDHSTVVHGVAEHQRRVLAGVSGT